MWDIVGDSWEDPYGGAGMLEIASLTLDEPELEEEVMGVSLKVSIIINWLINPRTFM